MREAACQFIETAITLYNSQNARAQELFRTAVTDLQETLTKKEQQSLIDLLEPKTKPILSVSEKSYLYFILKRVPDISPEDLQTLLSERYPRLAKEHPDFLQQTLTQLTSAEDKEAALDSLPDAHDSQDKGILTPERAIIMAGVDTSPHLGPIKIDFTPSRMSALAGKPSPFVESGLTFGGNPDALLTFPDGQQRRLNMLVIHLWSQGIDEVGGDKDMQYITAEEMQLVIQSVGRELTHPEDISRADIEKVKKYLKRKISQD